MRVNYANFITDDGLRHIAQLKSLEELTLARTHITDSGLQELKGLRSLRKLGVSGPHITQDGIRALQQALPHLEVGVREVRAALPQEAEEVSAIRQLGGSVRYGPKGRVRELDLRACRHPAQALRFATDLPGPFSVFLGESTTDADLANLPPLPNLRMLYLDHASVTDNGLVHLMNGQPIPELRFRNTAISDAGLAHLESIQGLERLQLVDTRVTEAGLATIAKLGNLKMLILYGPIVTDGGLAHLSNLKNLSTLYLLPRLPTTDWHISLRLKDCVR